MGRSATRVSRDVQVLFSSGLVADRTDGELLGCFIDRRDEMAFEALVQRHGPMVMGVCRRILRDPHDADDAFQATFLVLARKAGSIAPRDRVAGWLHGVAYRTALKAAAMAGRRRAREIPLEGRPEPESAPPADREWLPILDEELIRLPGKYRAPIVLCLLEGRPFREAAGQLGWPEGTLSGRLSRARRLLAERLTRRGVTLAGGSLFASASASTTSAALPISLTISTARLACLVAAGHQAPAGMLATLTQGVLTSMLIKKLMVNAAVVAGIAAGLGLASGPMLWGRQEKLVNEGGRPLPKVNPPLISEVSPASIPKVIHPKPKPVPSQAIEYALKWSLSEAGQEMGGPRARCSSGTPILLSNGAGMVDDPSGGKIPVGLVCSTTISPAKDDMVWVDVRADQLQAVPDVEDGLRMRGKTIRVIKSVKLGKMLSIVVDPARAARLDLTITRPRQ